MSITLNNITKSFGEKTVLDNLNLNFPKGSKTCIMGVSGCGKTTLLHIILGLLKPNCGTVKGVPDKISAVFQEDRLCESFSAAANILAVTGKTKTVKQIIECLSELGLSGNENIPVSNLSGGMRRRVAIARALCAESELIILDEPFKGLDDLTRETTVQTILSRTKGKTLIIATHDVRDAQLLDAQIIKLKQIDY